MPDAPRNGDLTLALQLADLADQVTMARFQASDLVVETKPDLTPVSDADRAVEREVRAVLAERRPDDAVLGEEFGAAAGGGSRRWVLDPIDGTENYVRGVPVWATLIALMDGDSVVAGAVSAPALGRRWWAARGEGAWGSVLGGEPRRLRVSGVGTMADASLAYSSLDGWVARGRLGGLLALMERVWRTRGYGDFYIYTLLAEGAVDIAVEPEVSLWDLAPLALLVTEDGGRFTDLAGGPGPGGGSAVASNGRLHDATLGYVGVTGAG
ncbi:MAG: histidinol-phosphatase [Mycobacteriales bacterium]